MHVAQLRVLQEQWVTAGRPGGFDTYVEARAKDMAGSIKAAGVQAGAAGLREMQEALHGSYRLYFDANTPMTPGALWAALDQPWMLEKLTGGASPLLLEFARKLIQMKQTGRISEVAVDSVIDKIKAWVAQALAALKQAYGAVKGGRWGGQLRDFVQDTEAMLGGDAGVRPFVPMTEATDEGRAFYEGTGAAGQNETRARFARPEEAERWYDTRADAEVRGQAAAWLDGRPLSAAIDELGSSAMPAGIPSEDVRQQALGMAIRRAMTLLDQGDEFARTQARVLANKAARLYQDAGRESARSMRQRGVVNHELQPHAPILAAEGVLIDRADAVMDKRFEGGAEGAAAKVKKAAEESGKQAGDALAGKLEGDPNDTPKQREAREKINRSHQTAQRILDALAARYGDAPQMPQRDQAVNAVRALYAEHVREPMVDADFVKRAVDLGVPEGLAGTLWEAAKLEIEAREMHALEQGRKPLDALLAKDSPQLARLLNELRRKMFPGMNWQALFEELPSQQRERQREIYSRLRKDKRLRGLNQSEVLKLTNELDKAWQRERRKVFKRELAKVGALGEKKPEDRQKAEKAMPKLLRAINLGLMTSETFREAVAPEYGLRMLTQAEASQLRALAEKAYAQPQGVLRNKVLAELLTGIQNKTGTSWSELINSYWTAAVLSGLRTQFDTWVATINGMGTNLIQAGTLIARGQGRAAVEAHAQWWRALKEGVRESGQILFHGDYSILKRFGEDLQKALDGESQFRPMPLGETLWKNGSLWQKWGMAPVMIWTGRLMAAADHINNTATTAGAQAVARALNPELYLHRVSWTAEEQGAARAQAWREVTGGVEPQTAADRATVQVRMRELLQGGLKEQDRVDASEIGDMAAYQNDPTGVFGGAYGAAKAGLGTLQRKLEDVAEDSQTTPAMRALLLAAAGSVHGITGTRFMRFGFNYGADITRYIPGTYRLGRAGFYGRNVSQMQQELLLGKNIVGVMLLSTLAAVFLGGGDDDEGWQIEGDWSNLTPQQQKERMAAGIERMTMWKRENGQVKRVSYKQWPTMGLFAAVGAMQDEKRHKPDQWASRGTTGHLMRAVQSGLFQIQNVSAMRGLADLFASPGFASDPATEWGERIVKQLGNFAGGFTPTLIKDAAIWNDPRNFKAETILEGLMRNQPILRTFVNDGRPQLNLLGEEVKLERSPWSRTYTNVESGEAHRVLGSLLSRGLALPQPSDAVKVYQDGVKVPLSSLGREKVWQYEKAVGEGYKAWLGSAEGAKLLTSTVFVADKIIDRRATEIKRAALTKVMAKR